jgi:hypothetical protein
MTRVEQHGQTGGNAVADKRADFRYKGRKGASHQIQIK